MRTTLMLDEDVAVLLKRVLAGRKDGLQAVINEALRKGLRQLGASPERKANYETPSVDTGRCLLPSIDPIPEILAVTESDRPLLG